MTYLMISSTPPIRGDVTASPGLTAGAAAPATSGSSSMLSLPTLTPAMCTGQMLTLPPDSGQAGMVVSGRTLECGGRVCPPGDSVA